MNALVRERYRLAGWRHGTVPPTLSARLTRSIHSAARLEHHPVDCDLECPAGIATGVPRRRRARHGRRRGHKASRGGTATALGPLDMAGIPPRHGGRSGRSPPGAGNATHRSGYRCNLRHRRDPQISVPAGSSRENAVASGTSGPDEIACHRAPATAARNAVACSRCCFVDAGLRWTRCSAPSCDPPGH